MRTFKPGKPKIARDRPLHVERRRPRAYEEWKALRRWRRLPDWETSPAGYLLRLAREDSGLTQTALAKKLGCSQQAIAQAERPAGNPTLRFVQRWRKACGSREPIESYVAERAGYGSESGARAGAVVRLDPDLAERFRTSAEVNRALHKLLREGVRHRHPPSKRGG